NRGGKALKKASWQKVINIFLIAILIFPTSAAHLFTPTVHAEGSEEETGWTTLSDGGNEINELEEVEGTEYVRLGSGGGNDNVDKPAVFREDDAEVTTEGTLSYTFISETEGNDTRAGFYPYYKDAKNFAFIGYDLDGWFYEYKIDGNGEWLTNRPETELPQKGESTDIEINYNELDVEVTLNGEELFDFSFNDDVSALFDEKSALKLGQYGQENSQFLIETDQDDNGSEGGDDGDDGDNGDGGDDGDDGDNGDGDDGDEPEGDKKA